MPQVDDLSRSLVAFDQDATLIVVVEMSEASWLVAGMAPGVDRQPLKKLGPDPDALLRLVERWRDEAVKAGRKITRIAFAAAPVGCAMQLADARVSERPLFSERDRWFESSSSSGEMVWGRRRGNGTIVFQQ